LQVEALCIRENVCGRNQNGSGENSKCDKNCKAQKEKEKITVFRYPKGCCKYKEELLPVHTYKK